MTPMHHVAPEMLLDYTAGNMPEPMALLVASHASLCSRCFEQVGELEAVGGELISLSETGSIDKNLLNQIFVRIDEGGNEVGLYPNNDFADWDDQRIPSPLRSYLPNSLENLDWERRSEGIEQTRLLNDFDGFDTRLFRLAPGVRVPRHIHEGEEATLVLSGGFSDTNGHYVRGDVALADSSVTHQPIADLGEPCISLAVTTGPLHLPGLVGQIIRPFVKL